MKVLMSAYACEPNKGSEPAIGWNWALQAARFHEVWVLTRANNRHTIESELNRRPVPNLHFVYHDLPSRSRFWKRGTRGIHLYYLLWQLSAVPICRRLYRQIGFDVAHHVTFVSYRFPSCLAWLPCPFIWGPVAGAETAPFAFYGAVGTRGMIQELIRDASNSLIHLTPLVRHTMKKSSKILAATEVMRSALPRWAQAKSLVVPAIGIEKQPEPVPRNERCSSQGLRILYVGRFLHWKGVRLAIHAFAEFLSRAPDAVFTLVGDGPERGHLERLAAKLRLGSRLRFEDECSHEEIIQIYEHHDVLLFPSLHDSGGLAVLEAMSQGLPVVCLNLGGTGMSVTDGVGIAVPARNPGQTIGALATALARLATEPQLRARMGEAGRQRAANVYNWDRKGGLLRDLYASVAREQQAILQAGNDEAGLGVHR